MTFEADVLEHAIRPAYALLPGRMATASATAMLLAIGLQEARLEDRRQIVNRPGGGLGFGPARGLWQFEPGGGVAGVRGHRATAILAKQALIDRNVSPTATNRTVGDRLAEDDVLAAVFARLLLYTVPAPLPDLGDVDEGWRQYLEAWRPGKPHRSTWDGFYARAWGATRA